MENYIPIGDMAKLNNISVQTLRHYDNIGLFKPVYIDTKTKYRYYSIEQMPYLDIIKSLKYIGLSLDEIKDIVLENENLDYILNKLKDQLEVIEDRITTLNKIKLHISSKIENIEKTKLEYNFGVVYKKEIEDRKCISLALDNIDTNRYEEKYMILKLRDIGVLVENEDIEEGNIGISTKYEKDKIIYESIFMTLDNNTSVKNVDTKVIPKGEYLCILYKGLDIDNMSYYKKLEEYIKHNNIHTSGNYYEISLINGITTSNPDDYIVEIQILIK